LPKIAVVILTEELKIMDEVRQLKARYFRFLDTKDWDSFAEVFCRDATFDLRAAATVDPNNDSPVASANVLKGRESIRSIIREAVGESITVHHGHCHEVWVDSPDEARGIIAMVDIITNCRTGQLILEGYGHYHETYRREDGVWRIWKSRLSRLRVTANLDA
jgi:hypothetical protein